MVLKSRLGIDQYSLPKLLGIDRSTTVMVLGRLEKEGLIRRWIASMTDHPEIAIVGAGIGGLALALGLHQRGIASRIYEVAPELRELGVGITILPHAMRELTALGLGARLSLPA